MYTCSKCGFVIDTRKGPLPTRCPRCGTQTDPNAVVADDDRLADASSASTADVPPPPPAAFDLPPPPPSFDLSPPPSAGKGRVNATIFGMPALTREDFDKKLDSGDPHGPPAIELDESGPPLELGIPAAPDRPSPPSPRRAPPPPVQNPAAKVTPPAPKRPLPPPPPPTIAPPLDLGLEDLPAPVEADLPTPRRRMDDFEPPPRLATDEIDLPALRSEGSLDFDGLDRLELDLPAPADMDLPTPVDNLLQPAISLPTPKHGGEVAPKYGSELAPKRGDEVAPKYGSELTPVRAPSVDELDLDLDLEAERSGAARPTEPRRPANLVDAHEPTMPRGPKVVAPKARVPSKRMLAGVGAAVALAAVGGGLYLGGVFDEGGSETRADDTTATARRDPGGPAQERDSRVLDQFALDTPDGYQQAIALTEEQGDVVGQAEASLLTHLRYGPEPVLAGQAEALLRPYGGQNDPFVRRVVGLAALAAGDVQAAETALVTDDVRTRLYRGWLRLEQDQPEQALREAEAVLATAAEDRAALELRHRAKVAAAVPTALDELRTIAAEHGDHLLLQVLLVEALLDQGFLADARRHVDSIALPAATNKGFHARLLVLRGRVAAAVGDRSGAVLRFDQALQLTPGDPEIALARLRVLMEARAFAEVKSALEILAREHPKLAEVPLLQAELATFMGDGDRALELLRAAAKLAPDDARVPYLLGQVHAMRMEVDEARAAFAKARQADPAVVAATTAEADLLAKADRRADALSFLADERTRVAELPGGDHLAAVILRTRARVLVEDGQRDQALAALDQALAAAPQDIDARLQRGILRLAAGNLEEAKQDLELVHQRTGGYPGLAGPLGRILIREGRIEELERLLGKQLDDSRATEDVLLIGARLRLEQGQADLAKSLADRVLATNPGSWEAHLLRARAFLAARDPEAAQVEITQARPKVPDAEVELWTGRVLEENGKFDEALTHYHRAATLDGTLLLARFHYGRALAQRGAAREALQVLAPVVQGESQFPGAWVAMGMAQRDLGKVDEAVRSFKKAVELDPELAEAHFWEGRLHSDRNQHGPAIKSLSRAIATASGEEPWVAQAHRLLGRAYVETGKKEDARDAYRKYLELAPPSDPGRAEATRRLREL